MIIPRKVHITLPDALLQRVDQVVHTLGTTRAAFIRQALESALWRLHEQELETRDAAGYAEQPQSPEEVAGWESVQDWGSAP